MKILLGITGSVAAIKSYELIMKLTSDGHEIKTVLTYSGEKFTSKYMLNALDGNVTSYDCDNFPHIHLNAWADMILVCPATANFLGKIANGIGDDLLSLICLTGKSKLVIAPAMNDEMWYDQAVQNNVQKLKDMNIHFLGPIKGRLACKTQGLGHIVEMKDILYMAKIREIRKNAKDLFPLKNKNVLILNGKTIEKIDEIRHISNKSSGKMGYALASVCREMGANVTLIQNDCYEQPCNVEIITVSSAEEMLEAALGNIKNKDVIINVAAITDIKCKQEYKNKANKTELISKPFQLELNPDLLQEISENLSNENKKPVLVGFCTETENNLVSSAKDKLIKKNLDFIVANPLETFGSDEIECSILDKSNNNYKIEKQSKISAAVEIINMIAKYLN